ncbi:folate receptor gamma-like [Ciona intestinalis]
MNGLSLYLVLLVHVLSHCIFSVHCGEEILSICMDGKHHKESPGPEAELFDTCSPWKTRSCCTNETAFLTHQDGENGAYNFNYNHCGVMSEKCRRHFNEDSCFYECSPNMGPWIVDVESSYRNQKFEDVPLCRSECDDWWVDCKDELTCKNNWSVGWNWTSGVNECPAGAECKKFSEYFTGAVDLCENIYPRDFKVPSNDSAPCMLMWFEGENPNDEVSRYYAKEKGLCCGSSKFNYVSYIFIIILAIFSKFLTEIY